MRRRPSEPATAPADSTNSTEQPDGPGRPTSHDVARLARVSQATVSRALGDGPSPVAPATRRRVELAAKRLGYVRNESGRILATRRTQQLGVVVDDLGNPFYLELIETLHRAADSVGFRLVVFTTQRDEEERARRLLDGSLDGVVLTTVELRSPLPVRLAAQRLPFVLLNRVSEVTSEADACVVDNEEGGRQVALELGRLGHRRVAAIFGPATTSTTQLRARGFRHGLTECGIRLPKRMTRHGRYAFEAGHDAMTSLMSEPRRPTAVFCANDVIALGALNAARALGIEVPAAVTIIGFDDIRMAGWELIQLTTVRQDLVRMTEIATELLVARIAAPDRPFERVVLPAELVLRGTHAAPLSSP